MTAPARRPWWKRKRWWAAIVLWLLLPVLYALSTGPALYVIYAYCRTNERGQHWYDWYEAVYGPAERAVFAWPVMEEIGGEYQLWWIGLGISHGESE